MTGTKYKTDIISFFIIIIVIREILNRIHSIENNIYYIQNNITKKKINLHNPAILSDRIMKSIVLLLNLTYKNTFTAI